MRRIFFGKLMILVLKPFLLFVVMFCFCLHHINNEGKQILMDSCLMVPIFSASVSS